MRLTRKKMEHVLFAAAPQPPPPEFQVSKLLAGRLTLKPCRGHAPESVSNRVCITLLPAASLLHKMAMHSFGLADVDLAIRSVGGQGAPGAVHVTVLPWMSDGT